MKFLSKGQRIPKADYAAIAQAVQDWQLTQPGQRSPSASGQGAQFITVRNDTGVALDFGSVLGICGVPNTPDTPTKLNLFKYDGNALVCGDMPTSADAGKFLITQEPCREGGYCKAVISGPAKVKIDMLSDSHEFADVTDGDTVLTSGDTGVPILWKEAGTGEKWAIVNIGGGSGGEEPYPFKLLATAFDDGTLENTFQVNAGTVACSITLHPDNDNSQVTPISIVVPPSSTLYKVWLALTITAATGAMSALTIDSGASGWLIADGDAVNYPTNAPASAGAGLAPTKLYILLSEITTDVAGAVTRFPTTMAALKAGRKITNLACSGASGFQVTYEMEWGPAS